MKNPNKKITSAKQKDEDKKQSKLSKKQLNDFKTNDTSQIDTEGASNQATPKKLNIGFFCDSFYPMIDGVVSVVNNYAKRLCKIANVTVFTTSPRDKNYKDNFPYKVVRCQKFQVPGLDYDLGLPTMDSKFQKELKDSKLDIVHIHSPFSVGKAGVIYAKKHKIPSVATNHSQFKQDFFKATNSPALTQILLNNIIKVFDACDENWAVNDMTADLFVDYGLTKKPYVMQNGTDFNPADSKKYKVDINKKYKILPTDKVLLFVGRMNVLKNVPILFDVLNILLKYDTSYKLLLVGGGQDLDDFKKQVKKMELSQNVIFAGKVSNQKLLGSIYKRADLFTFPSLYDTDGIVKKEAAAFKTPSLVVEKSLTSSNITNNVDGYICKNDANDIANRILQIFKNEQQYNMVCENCLKNIYKSWDSIIESAYNRYLYLINKKKNQLRAQSKTKHYQKTIKAVKKQKFETKRNENKKLQLMKKNMQKYPKTMKALYKKQREIESFN